MQAPAGLTGSYVLAGSKNPGAVGGSFTYVITNSVIQADGADLAALYAAVGFLVIMSAPGGLSSVSVPSTAATTIVQSPTGLKSGVTPPNIVYSAVNGQIFANPADIPQLFLAGFRVVA